MDFFEAQDRALRFSRRLVLLFVAAVAAMIALVYLTILVLWTFSEGSLAEGGWFQPGLLAGVAVGMLVLIAAGATVRTAQLRKGGAAVAEMLGGRPVRPDSSDPAERQFWNVVEEMAIASGTPVPAVFVLPEEPGINAFAAGHTIHDAAVAVTRGALEALDRDELQGVVAHEFSHILNGDMRLNLRLVGLLFGILLLTVVGRGIAHGSRGGRGGGRKGGQAAILGLVLILLGYLGVVFGRLIQAAVSRQREYLADAAAVQFTRNPSGIAGALRKIAGGRGSQIRDHHAQELGHLFFADGMRGAFSRAMATHPPLIERIRRIESGGAGVGVAEGAGAGAGIGAFAGATVGGAGDEADAGAGDGADARAGARAGGTSPWPATILASTGSPTPEHLVHARGLIGRFPEFLSDTLHAPDGAADLIVALLLSEDPETRARQVASAEAPLGRQLAARAEELRPQLAELGPETRLPLLDLALPALRMLSDEESRQLEAGVSSLIQADGEVKPFEFALFHVLRRSVFSRGDSEPPLPHRSEDSPNRLRSEIEVVLSAVARAGSGAEEEVQEAFRAGAALLPEAPEGWILHSAGEMGLHRIDEALDRLESAAPAIRKALLQAAAITIRADQRVEVAEVETLRAIAEAIDTPIPPIPSPLPPTSPVPTP